MIKIIIYKATNIKNGKIYIGLTTKTLEERIKHHKRDSLRMDTYFYRAIKKHGFDSFKWEVIDNSAKSIQELEDLEKYYIKKYNCFNNKKVGYNSLSGGNSLFEVSDDIRKIRSENAKGTNNPMYGKPGTWLGKNFSDTHKENISKSLKGKNKEYLLGGKNHAAKGVVNLTTGEVFETIIEAANKYNITREGLSLALRKDEKICKGYYWDYVCNVDLNNLELKTVDINKRYNKRVLCVDTGDIYNSVSHVAKQLNCCRKSIRNACNKNVKFRGMSWEFICE